MTLHNHYNCCRLLPPFCYTLLLQVGEGKCENCHLYASEKHSPSVWDQNQWQWRWEACLATKGWSGSLTGTSCSHLSTSAPSWLQLWGKPFAVGSQCVTARVHPVQVEKVYTREVVVKVKVSVETFDNFCSQAGLNSVSLLSCIDLKSRHIPIGGFWSGPHLNALLYLFERHVLLQGGFPFEGNYGLVYADVPTWLVHSSYPIGLKFCYWPDLSQPIVLWTSWWE